MKILLDISHGEVSISDWIHSFLSRFFQSYWFLWAVFFANILVKLSFFTRYPKISQFLFSIFLIVVPSELIPIVGFPLFMLAFMFPFFCIGSWAGQLNCEESNLKNLNGASIFAALLAIFSYILIYKNWSYLNYSYNNKLNIFKFPVDVFIMFISGFFGSISFMAALKVAYRYLSYTKISLIMEHLGTKTLQIYLAQNFIFEMFRKLSLMNFPKQSYLLSLIICTMISIILIITIAACEILTARHLKKFYSYVWGSNR